jgi:DNA-binding beta-propeller fold protein YncE
VSGGHRRVRRSHSPAVTAKRALLGLSVALALAPAPAGALVGVSFSDGLVYDVDAQTGAATSPRALEIGTGCPPPAPCETAPIVALSLFAGIEVDASGALLLATVHTAPFYPDRVFLAADGAPPEIASFGAAGAQVGEGDLALEPSTGALYAIGLTNQIAPFLLLRIDDPGAPSAIVVGQIGSSDISGLAFDGAARLWALDTDQDLLLELDPDTAETIDSVALSTGLGQLAGMDFDFESGAMFVADGGTGGTNTLYTLDVATGALASVGPLGIAGGLSGLAAPEPQSALLGAAAVASLAGVVAARRRTGLISNPR